MRIVLCDEDAFLREVIEDIVQSTGHEVAGIADSPVSAVNLIEASRPDAVILDLSLLGYGTDFNVIESADDVGARVVVFSRDVDLEALERYDVKPEVVVKPDLDVLEQVLLQLGREDDEIAGAEDRRSRPTRVAAGPRPTGVADAQAFFEAMNDALPGDGMLSIDVGSGAEDVARDATRLMRDTDRLLAFPTSVRLYLPGSEEVGIRSLLRRIWDAGAVPAGSRAVAVVVRDGEIGADAFDRLKQDGVEQPLPPPT